MKKYAGWIAGIALLALMAWVLIFKVHFDWKMFWVQLKTASPAHIAIGIALIYASYLIRSWRWAIFLRPGIKVGPLSLLGSQFIGFAAVALFGRLADLSRPYLIARRTQTDVATQVAVYTVERMFDLGAAAIVFSTAFAFAPKDMPHHDAFARVGVLSLAGTLGLVVIAFLIRVAGPAVAGFARKVFGRLSKGFGEALAQKILAFREGLNAISSLSEFAAAAVMSLAMWLMIAFAYYQTTHAFTYDPTLAHLTFAQVMLLMAASIGGSLLQLPILGWFTQIAVTSAAMHASYGTSVETATSCGALLLIVTFICVIPIGLIFAQVESVSLRALSEKPNKEISNAA